MKRFIVALVLAVIILIGFNVYSLISKEEIAFVDIGRLQDGYLLKKDLEEKAKGKLLVLKNIIDSLEVVKKLQPVSNSYTSLDTNIARMQYEFKRIYGQSNDEISVDLWKRLNPLMETYGKKHKYRMIIGANGAGTVMYGAKHCDITDDLIKYVNHDYAPGK